MKAFLYALFTISRVYYLALIDNLPARSRNHFMKEILAGMKIFYLTFGGCASYTISSHSLRLSLYRLLKMASRDQNVDSPLKRTILG